MEKHWYGNSLIKDLYISYFKKLQNCTTKNIPIRICTLYSYLYSSLSNAYQTSLKICKSPYMFEKLNAINKITICSCIYIKKKLLWYMDMIQINWIVSRLSGTIINMYTFNVLSVHFREKKHILQDINSRGRTQIWFENVCP